MARREAIRLIPTRSANSRAMPRPKILVLQYTATVQYTTNSAYDTRTVYQVRTTHFAAVVKSRSHQLRIPTVC